MRDKMMDYQTETNHLYNLEATPAEGLTRRVSRIDKDKYKDIIVANEEAVSTGKASPYYTNSSQLPVNFTDDIFEAFDLQDDVQTRYTGGTVLHGFIGEAITSPEAVKKLVKTLSYNYHLPYFTITPTFSICPKHGYLAGEHIFCPKCDADLGYVEARQAEERATILL
jgi:ribonucleoside-triphosphate reductase